MSYTTRIFSPTFTFHCATRSSDGHEALKAMLNAIDDDSFAHYAASGRKVFPLRTLYHNFKKNILVLTNADDCFMGQVFKDGQPDILLHMQDDKTKVRQFFSEAGEELTVLDFYTGKELTPDHQTVEAYMERVLAAEKELDEHRGMMEAFRERHRMLRLECEAFYSTSPATSYKKAIHLLHECMDTAEGIFRIQHQHTCREIESFFSFPPEQINELKLFGLYVYVLKYGTDHKRFLKRGKMPLSLTFNQMLSDMRKFIADHDGIVDQYTDYMQLTKNERENLMFLLSEEQLASHNKSIGDELFC